MLRWLVGLRGWPAALRLSATAVFLGARIAAAADPPYEPQLQRLAEILGSLHYLDQLCGGTAPAWRDEMAALLTAEAPEADRRARLVDRFNLGYGSFAAVYRTCTPSAVLALERYKKEGAALTRDIADRFGR